MFFNEASNVAEFDQSRDTLQSLVQSCHCANQSLKLQEMSIEYSFDHISECKNNFTTQQNTSLLLSFKKNVENNRHSKFQQEKQSPISSQGTTSIASNKFVLEKTTKTNKARIRWTEDLHKKFIESLNQLGGAKQAMPKEILKLMDCEGLTIFHVKSHLQKYRVVQFMEEAREGLSFGSHSSNAFECKNLPTQQNKSMSESLRNFSHYSKPNFKNNMSVENNCCSKFQQEKQPRFSSHGTTLIASNRVILPRAAKTNKTRIKWTNHLQQKFIESVNRLGGARKATPMGILKLMNCEGLTIFHVKSHLQKYRVAQLMQEATKGNVEHLDSKTGVQIVEALRLQLNVQQGLYEQLENQKKLQVWIEEQAKQLQIVIQSQLKKK